MKEAGGRRQKVEGSSEIRGSADESFVGNLGKNKVDAISN